MNGATAREREKERTCCENKVVMREKRKIDKFHPPKTVYKHTGEFTMLTASKPLYRYTKTWEMPCIQAFCTYYSLAFDSIFIDPHVNNRVHVHHQKCMRCG